MRPLLFSALSFMCGIAAGDFFEPGLSGSVIFSAVFFIAASSAFLFKKHIASFYLILFSVFCLGSASIAHRNAVFQRDSGLVSHEYYGKAASVEGLISQSPSFSTFTVFSEDILIEGERQKYSAEAVVLNRTDFRGYDYGDRVRVRGVLRENFISGGGAGLMLGVYSPSWIENLGPGDVNFITRSALGIRKKIEEVIDNTMPEPESLFLKSILLGKRHVLPDDIRRVLSEIGAGHFLSVSGLHAGLVLFFLLAVSGLAGFSRKQAAVLSIAGLVLFCFMTGARVPTVRAVVLASVVLSGTLLGRRVDRWNALALAAVLILSVKPEELFSAGFQLSFAAAAGVFYLYPAISGLWPPGGKLSFLRRPVPALASIHLAVTPLLGMSYGYVPAVSPLANLVLVPLLSISAGLGFSAGIVGQAFIFPAQVISAANWGVVRVLLRAAEFFHRAPGLIFFDNVPGYAVIFYYAGLLMLPAGLNKYFSGGSDEGE